MWGNLAGIFLPGKTIYNSIIIIGVIQELITKAKCKILIFIISNSKAKLMDIINYQSAPRYQRDNIESFLLISKKTTNSENLSITLVKMQPGGIQHIHSHKPEQMYYILEGEGLMTVENEEQMVYPGDAVFIPSNSKHGLINKGEGILSYLSAASPSFSMEQCEKLWPLASLKDLK